MTPHKRRYRNEWKGHQTLLFFCISVFFSFSPSIPSVQAQDTLAFRVVSYNVENLFDTRHDSLKDDYEFLPESTRHWNYPKYRKKLDDIGRTLIAVGGWTPPALVALCEVENDSVLRDLTRYSVLREAGYRYVMTHSRDERGIDVALLYQRGLFKLLSCHSITVSKPRPSDRPTRDILHASGLLLNGDTLDVLVAHFPSRSGGAKESEPYRLMAAHQLKRTADSLIARRRYPQLLIMGDFNDYPHNRSVQKYYRPMHPSRENQSPPDVSTICLPAKPGHKNRSAATSIRENGDCWTTSSYRATCCKQMPLCPHPKPMPTWPVYPSS